MNVFDLRRILGPIRRHPAIFHMIRDACHPRQSVYRHLHFRGPFTVRVSEHANFRINHFGYQVENELFWAGFGNGYEGIELRIWSVLTKSAEFIADVGANTGVFALAAAAVNPGAKIVALEPVARIYEKLVANVALNPFDVRVLQIAASDTDGEAVLFDTFDEHNYSASLDANMLDGRSTERVPVRTARLDSLFCKIGWPRIDLLKIDVERHEPAVISGMLERLATDRPTILIEILDEEIGRSVWRPCERLDYRCAAIDETKGLLLMEKPELSEGRNFLFCPAEKWEAIGAEAARVTWSPRNKCDERTQRSFACF